MAKLGAAAVIKELRETAKYLADAAEAIEKAVGFSLDAVPPIVERVVNRAENKIGYIKAGVLGAKEADSE